MWLSCCSSYQMSSKESESQFWRGGPYDNRNNMSLFNFSQTLESVPCVVTQHNLQQTFSSAFPWINGSRRQIPTSRADDINILLEFPFVNIVLLSGLNQTNGRRGRCRAGPDKEVTLHFILEVGSDLSIGTKMTAKERENKFPNMVCCELFNVMGNLQQTSGSAVPRSVK